MAELSGAADASSPTPGPGGDLFGPLLRRLRTARLLSQQQLAERAGLSVRTLSNLESGRVLNPRGATVGLLSEALGLSGPERAGFEEAALDLVLAAAAASGPGPAASVPAELPLDVHGFFGRARELAELWEMVVPRPARPDAGEPVRVCVVSGTPGVGKTALAIHWVQQARALFPDGQLFADLRGYGSDRPREPADVLGAFLRSLGVAAADIPDDPDERAARYRTELDGRRILVLLDNAATVEQVRPLLPGTLSGLLVVTSRSSLSGLVVRDGARRLELDRMPAREATELLRRLSGSRLDAIPEAAAALAEQCAGLPLALRLTAELAERGEVAPARLVEEFADEPRRLDLLAATDDPASAVRVAFSWSYGRLPAPAARAFRMLGLHPGADFDPYDVAALTGTGLAEAGRLLDQLVRAHLAEARPGHRYGLHDLLRAYAAECAHRQEPAAARHEALLRLLDHYLRSAALATDLVFPGERTRRPGVRRPDGLLPDLTDSDGALAWLDAQRRNLVDAVVAAAREDAGEHATDLSVVLWRYLFLGHYDDARTVHRHALAAARRRGDQAAEATSLHHLATISWRLDRLDQALAGYQAALRIRRALGDATGESATLNNLSIVLIDFGRYAEALRHLDRVLVLRRQVGDRIGEAKALGNLGIVHGRLGRFEESVACTARSLEICREEGDQANEAAGLDNLGLDHCRQGLRPDLGYEHSAQALEIYRRLGDRGGIATALTSLALAQTAMDRPAEALAGCDQALRLCRSLGDRGRESEILNTMGEALWALGRGPEARARHRAAEAISRSSGSRYELARSLIRLAETAAADDRPGADRCWQEALALCESMEVPVPTLLRHPPPGAAVLRPPAVADSA